MHGVLGGSRGRMYCVTERAPERGSECAPECITECAPESVTGMRNVIDGLTAEMTGTFQRFDGGIIEW